MALRHHRNPHCRVKNTLRKTAKIKNENAGYLNIHVVETLWQQEMKHSRTLNYSTLYFGTGFFMTDI